MSRTDRQPREIPLARVHDVIALVRDHDRRNGEDRGGTGLQPSPSDLRKRLRWGELTPVLREVFDSKGLDRHIGSHLDRDRHEIERFEIRVRVDDAFERRELERGRCVDSRQAARRPAAAVEPRPFSIEPSVRGAGNPPDFHYPTTPCSILPRTSST